MNALHHWMCRSAKWRSVLESDVLPWTLQQVPLGPDLLEIGPGPGLTTDLLNRRAARLTAVEIDAGLARSLASRFAGTNVSVVRGDATALPFGNASFSSATAFTMLHHLPDREAQDRLFREVYRVLRPASAFVGSDSLDSFFMRLVHLRDTLVPLDPNTLAARLEQCGFRDVQIEVRSRRVRFEAYRH